MSRSSGAERSAVTALSALKARRPVQVDPRSGNDPALPTIERRLADLAALIEHTDAKG